MADDDELARIARALESPEVLAEILRDLYRVLAAQRKRLDAIDLELGRIERSVRIPDDGTRAHPTSVAGILAAHEQPLERLER